MINPHSPVLLDVRGLCASVNGIDILKGLDFTVRRGEVHAIMGPNGSGKSTFAKVLAGHTAYTVTAGTVKFEGQDLLALAPDARALAGVFLGFQYPIEIPGVANSQFLRLSYNTLQAQHGRDELIDAVRRAAEHHLHQALTVPQINEDDAPMITTTMNPATQVDFLIQMTFRYFSTAVATHD